MGKIGTLKQLALTPLPHYACWGGAILEDQQND